MPDYGFGLKPDGFKPPTEVGALEVLDFLGVRVRLLEPGEKLIVERHEEEPGKATFTVTERKLS